MGRLHEQQKKKELKSLRSGFRDHYLLLQVPKTDISIELSAVTMPSLYRKLGQQAKGSWKGCFSFSFCVHSNLFS